MRDFIDQILAIVVLYNQDYKSSITLSTLNKAVKNLNKDTVLDVFIYDNSPHRQSIEYEFENLNLYHVYDKSNPGVSKAYNEGAKYAIKHNKYWLLLLDQNTNIGINAFLEYYSSSNSGKANLYVPLLRINASNSILSPFSSRFNRGYGLKDIKAGVYLLNKYKVVNSGIFVRRCSYEECGGYNEKVFLDYSDYEFIRSFSKLHTHFVVINSIWYQDFSANVYDEEAEYKRFKIFISSISGIKKDSFYDKITFFFLLLIRGLKLGFKYKKIRFIRLVLNEYF